MLQGAAAANAEMRANRRDPIRAPLFEREEPPPVGMARHGIDLDGLAGKRTGNKEWAVGRVGHAVTAMAEAGNSQAFNHAWPR